MKTKKRRMEYISFYNHTGLEKHFSKMAKKGWLIESISNFYWTYRKIDPKDIHFCVTYYPRASDFDPDPSPQQQTFHDFCAHTGWQLCCTWHQMQVFCNEKENPVPLETDPVLEVETLHTACKKNYLPSHFLLLALGLFLTGSSFARLFTDPIGLLSNASLLFSGFCHFCIMLTSAAELVAYFFWYFKARKAAQDGIFVDTPSTTKFQISIVFFLLLALVWWLTNLFAAADPLLGWVATVMLVGVIGVMLLINGIKQGLKKAKASRGVNRFLTIFSCFVLSFAISGGIVHLALFANSSGFIHTVPKSESIPLSLADLYAINVEEFITRDQNDQSVLLCHRTVHQYPIYESENTSNMPELHYAVTTVKLPFLYGWVKNQHFNGTFHSSSTIYAMDYDIIDPTPWGAEEAYRQLDAEGNGKTSFLLFYESNVVLIHFDWEPTEEQMTIVSQKLNP